MMTPKPQKTPARSGNNNRAPEFAFAMRLFGDDAMRQYQPEYRFHATRRWQFDFAWPQHRLAVEIDGGQYLKNGGRHNQDSDREKINEAIACGWSVLRFSPQQVERDPAGCVDVLRRALQCR